MNTKQYQAYSQRLFDKFFVRFSNSSVRLFDFSDESLDLTMLDDGQLTIQYDGQRWALTEVHSAEGNYRANYTATPLNEDTNSLEAPSA